MNPENESSAGAVSKDGLNWTLVDIPSIGTFQGCWNGIAYDNGTYVAVAGALGAGANNAAWSNDGVKWFGTVMPSS